MARAISTSQTPEETLKYRKDLVKKGWCTQSDIKKFVPCGNKKAKQIYEEIRNCVEVEGFENLCNCILTDRLIKYMHLSKKELI